MGCTGRGLTRGALAYAGRYRYKSLDEVINYVQVRAHTRLPYHLVVVLAVCASRSVGFLVCVRCSECSAEHRHRSRVRVYADNSVDNSDALLALMLQEHEKPLGVYLFATDPQVRPPSRRPDPPQGHRLLQ